MDVQKLITRTKFRFLVLLVVAGILTSFLGIVGKYNEIPFQCTPAGCCNYICVVTVTLLRSEFEIPTRKNG